MTKFMEKNWCVSRTLDQCGIGLEDKTNKSRAPFGN